MEERHLLPEGYRLDRSDPDLWVLCEPDGAMLEAFWPEVATPENLRRAVEAHRLARREDLTARTA